MGVDAAVDAAAKGSQTGFIPMEVSQGGGSSLPPGAVALPPGKVGFRGRAQELTQVRCALRALACGVPVRMLVTGEQGIGKSRLIAEALATDDSAGIILYTGRAAELEADRPFGSLIDALGLDADATRIEHADIARRIASAARGAGGDQRHEVVKRIAKLVRRNAATTPVALIIEDVQWADRLTVAALNELIAACADLSLGIFLTRRLLPLTAPVDDLLDHDGPRMQRIELDALDPEVTALLAHDVLGMPPGPRLQQQIDGAGGNPAMVLALLQGSNREGTLRRRDGAIEANTPSPPASMRPAILTRIARLSDRCQDLLTVAAVFERPFGVATLAAVAGRAVIDVLTDLREALGARLLVEVAGVLSFRHQLVRQILYEATPVTVRAELHAQISRALEIDHGSAELIVQHHLRAVELGAQPSETGWRPAPRLDRISEPWERLTRTEHEVALLAAQGLSNKQLGVRLQVSARTIETHLAHVYAKLGLHSRVELAAEVGRAGMGAPDAELMIVGRVVGAEVKRRPLLAD